MYKQFKNIIRQIHLWLGLGTGLIVFIVSITGCIYVFEEEIREATQKDRLYVPMQEANFVGVDQLIENFEKLVPNEKISTIRISNKDSNATVEIGSKSNTYYFDLF